MGRAAAWARAVGAAIVACLTVAGLARAADVMSWRLLADSAPLPPSLAVPMGVYDPVRHRVLAVDSDYRYDLPVVVHVFDPGPEPRWSTLEVSGTAPMRRNEASLVYDPVRDRLLLVGTGWSDRVDVWALRLAGTPAWESLATNGTAPGGRSGQSTIYDPAHDRLVLFGGRDQSSPQSLYLSDLWALSLATDTWSPLAPGGVVPGGREGHGAMYDPERQRMIVFGGHYEDPERHFRNDLWELSLGDSVAWSEIVVGGPVPGARSAFGTVYDPVRRRMLVHGGVNDQSGVDPDDLWALALDGTPEWTQIATEDTLRGRSYPVDVYDPVEDLLLACGGHGYPQTSALPLAAPLRWTAVLPPLPLPAPGAHSGDAVLHDSRRDRFLVIGGALSSVDSAVWIFDAGRADGWHPVRAPGPPPSGAYYPGYAQSAVYDSLGDRVLWFDGSQAWASPALDVMTWTALGPPLPQSWTVGQAAGVALDARRNRLIVSGGYIYYPHSAGYSQTGVWALSLGSDASWSHLDELPQPLGSAGHDSYYDPAHDRLVVLGGFELDDMPSSRRYFGATVWTTPLDSVLQWTQHPSSDGVTPPGPPVARATFDPRLGRLFVCGDSTVWTRGIDDTLPWRTLELSSPRPTVTQVVAYDPVRDQLLALFASLPGSDRIQAWALGVGPLAVALVATSRSEDGVGLTWQSITAYGRPASVERREEPSDWVVLGPIAFGSDGLGAFVDHGAQPEHDYWYRVSVPDGDSTWHSDPVLVTAPGSLQLALYGVRPNPAVGAMLLTFSLPGLGPARLEIFDVRGRRWLSRDVGPLGPGRHVLWLEASGGWPPGVYYGRLRRGGESRTARMVLMR